MNKLNLIILTFVVLLLAGCSATGNVVNDDASQDSIKSLEVMVHSNDQVAAENEVSLFLTNGGFSPAVIEVEVGQTIIVTSYYVDDVHFSLYAFGVEEPLDEAESFRFVADEKGEFPFVCMDCSPMLKGLLVVN